MHEPTTTSLLILLTALSVLGSGMAIRRLRRPGTDGARAVTLIALTLTALSAATLIGRVWARHELWAPLGDHVDGLLLIGTLTAAATAFIRLRPRMYGLSAFALPVLTGVYAWAICASWWTYKPFELDNLTPVWSGIHRVGVYLGTLCFVLAAAAGAMYLYAQARLKRKDNPTHMGRLPSLEKLEGMVIGAATIGFAVLSLGLVAGVVILGQRPEALGPHGWLSPKVLLAALVWLTYAVVINVRFTRSFRGARAAWLAIAGLVLLLGTYALITPGSFPRATDPPPGKLPPRDQPVLKTLPLQHAANAGSPPCV